MKSRRRRSTLAIPIVIERTRSGYSAFSPAVAGCVTVGKSIDETIQHMREALRDHLQLLQLIKRKPINVNRILRFAFEERGDEAVYAVVKLTA